MNTTSLKFEDYQAKYEGSFLPEEFNIRLKHFRNGVHRIVSIIDGAYQQGPDIIIRTVQFCVILFSCIPSINSCLEFPKQFCREAKNFTNFIKGLKSVDGILNLKNYALKSIILNVSGTVLFIISSITLIERFKLLDVSGIKTILAAIPVLGILPYGGLTALSMALFMSSLAILTIDKNRDLNKEKNRIEQEKLPFWTQPLDLTKIREKQGKYHVKIEKLRDEIHTYEELIEKGKQTETDLKQQKDQLHRIKVCQKAIQELTLQLKVKQALLEKNEEKTHQWSALEWNWDLINPEELEKFRQVKANKWQEKLKKVDLEKKCSQLSIAMSITTVAKQVFAIGCVMAGYGVVALPIFLNSFLEFFLSGGGFINFFMKRHIKKIEPQSVDLAHYVNLDDIR